MIEVHKSERASKKLETTLRDWTSLDELDKAERHLNQGKPVLERLGIKVF